MNNRNIQHVVNALARIKQAMAKGEKLTGAHQWKLLKKAHAKYSKQMQEFTNPKAPARPRPMRLNDHMQAQLFNR